MTVDPLWLVALLIAFVVGLALGSFVNEQLARWAPKTKHHFSWCSKCENCGRRLSWWQLMPLISQLFLHGHCFYCRRHIPRAYWWTELGVGLTTAALFWRLGNLSFLEQAGSTGFFSQFWQDNFLFLAALLFSLVFWFAAWYDTRYLLLPDGLMLPAIGVALLGRFYWQGWTEWPLILLGGLVPAAFFTLLVGSSRGKWMGGGDIRLAALVGLLFPWLQALVAFILSFVLGAVVGLVLVSSRKATGKTALPYAPFLALGAFLAVLWGEQLAGWYVQLFL